MTNKTSIAFAFAFAAVMLAWPMTAQNVIADGDASITGECGFDTPGDINLGAIAIGSDSTEVATPITMTGTETGTLELQAEDWEGVGTFATGSITLVGLNDAQTITIDDTVFTADDSGTPAAGEFDIGANDQASATNLAALIGTDETDVTANVPTGTNVVLIAYNTLGTAGNAIALEESAADGTVTLFPSDDSLDGAEAAGVVHMASESVRFVVANNGATDVGQDYTTGKAATGVDDQVFVLTTNTNPGTVTTLYLQASGDGTLLALPYSGALTSVFAFGSTCN